MYENYHSQHKHHHHQPPVPQYVQHPYQVSQYTQPQLPSIDAVHYQPSSPSSSTQYYIHYPNYTYPQHPPQAIQPIPNQPYYPYPNQIQMMPPSQQIPQNIPPPAPSIAPQYSVPQQALPRSHQPTANKVPSIMPNFGKNSFLHSGEFRFTLEVAQHPVRARMCGFGDKDRRQITSPPCVRLRIFNIHTDAEFTDISTIDTSFYALLVELWSVDMTTNMSLVHPSGQIYQSSTNKNQFSNPAGGSSNSSNAPGYNDRPSQVPSSQYPQYYQNSSSSNFYKTGPTSSSSGTHNPSPPTRNLIGSLVATAHKLHDLSDELGIWFILQDLSVRTEGEFRLKFSFVNLANAVSLGKSPSSSSSANSAPIIASVFSNPFRSYSAKKFPGVIDSTELSRCFANQGIKIPIRREHKSRERKQT